MVRLVWKTQGGSDRTFTIAKMAVLGREPNLECILDVKSVSRKHARIELRGDEFFIADLGSTNGTWVNGVRIQRETRLDLGDRVQLGDEVLEFEAVPPTTSLTGNLTLGSLETAPFESHVRLSPGVGKPCADGASQHHEQIPRRHGRFYLLRRLGQGGMGTVYRAIDLDSNREVAVKFIRSTTDRKEAFMDFFHNREAVLAREVDHPNVIRVFEHGVDGDRHFISMEYVEGRSLFHIMKERKLQPLEVLEILKQVACGLVAAHRQGVVHSDIKPANVLLVGGRCLPRESAGPEAATDLGFDPAQGILEFDFPSVASSADSSHSSRYDAGLVEEIRRRAGEPVREAALDPPYFPRQSEWNFLSHYFDRISEGRGYFLLVEGEAGTGKNRLVSEFLRTKEAQGVHCESGASGKPTRLLEFDCSRIEGLPHLHEQIMGAKPASNLSLRQIAEQIQQWFSSTTGPVVLRLLSLGAAIPVACDLLTQLAPLLQTKRLLLVGTMVLGEIRTNGSLKQFLERVTPATKELYLRPLTGYQIQRYLQLIFRDSLTGLDLASHLYRLSRGNFAKLLEIIRGFLERGVLSLDRVSGRITYRPRQQEFELAEGKSLHEKYRSCGKMERHVLEMAAFVGPHFIFDTLLRLHDINETSLFFIVRSLLAEGFITEEGRTWYGFTNVAFQHYAADRIPEQERPHLHRRLSRLLQTVPVLESPELQQLRARHLAGCHEYSKAVEALLEGAHLARCEYQADLACEMMQEIVRIYRLLARREDVRKEVREILREWFRKDGNWYAILGGMSSEVPVASVKIADFGISFRMKDDARGYQLEKLPVLGTPRYMAPERGKDEYGGFKSDVFSLGIMAFEMATGAPPFPELRGRDTIQANREIKITLPREVLNRYPIGMEALFLGMVEKDPRKRWDAKRVVRELVKLQYELDHGRGGRN